MLSWMKLTDEAIGVVIANESQGLTTIDGFSQLNEKFVEGIWRVLRNPGGTTGGVYNTGVAVSEMTEAILQLIIYYIKSFKSIGRTCTHADTDLSKFRAVYHQRDMEESHKDPKVVPTVDPRDWPKTLETVEEYIRGFHGVDVQPLIYGLRDDLIALVVTSYIMYRGNGSKYFTQDDEMIAQGFILSGPVVLGTDPE